MDSTSPVKSSVAKESSQKAPNANMFYKKDESDAEEIPSDDDDIEEELSKYPKITLDPKSKRKVDSSDDMKAEEVDDDEDYENDFD